MTEEERAAAYLLQAARREAYAKMMDDRLAGSEAARATLAANWEPIVQFNEQLKEQPDGDPEEPRQWNG